MKKCCNSDNYASLNVSSLGANDFIWLYSSIWNNSHTNYFAGKRGNLPAQISICPPYQIARKTLKSKLGDRWVLEKPANTQVAWAEGHGFYSSFKKIFKQIEWVNSMK